MLDTDLINKLKIQLADRDGEIKNLRNVLTTMTFINVVYVQTIPENPSIKNVTFARSMFVGRASSGVMLFMPFLSNPVLFK